MNNFIGKNIRSIVEVGPFLTAFFLILFLVLLVLMLRKNRYYLPKNLLQALGSFLLILLLGFFSLVFWKINQMRPKVMPILQQMDDLIGQPAPALTYTKISDQQRAEVQDYQGQVVLVNYWATWCRPCIQEIPDLQALEKKYRSQGLKIIMISDEEVERLQKFAVKHELDLEIGTTPTFSWAALGNDRPATFLVNKEGKVMDYFTGARDLAFFEEKLEKYWD